MDPKAPLGPHPHPHPPGDPRGTEGAKGTQRDPRERARGAKGPKGAFGALGGDGPMGPFGVIPQPFRMESHSERTAITRGVHLIEAQVLGHFREVPLQAPFD